VIVIVVAVVISKRRPSAMHAEVPSAPAAKAAA